MMPFIVSSIGLTTITTPEDAKLQLARHWRHADRVRNPRVADELVTRMYERLINIQQQDVWGGMVAYLVAPHGYKQYCKNHGYSYLNEVKYGKKSSFMEKFYEGDKQNVW